ncbi:hypothetical protein POSPLADRAFT_1047155 [Postia placenta MAD-698-R-SB12]|uniref:Uncharacterized protein n=1 Tax=Postia placenta MAD-698-R-SB12 TaxID=670580 RepID=A0A1X6MWP9_9APHY|nr:hypothetical protein POSPLADRAFT_1047155 [Postia placenta MAD-698-R-SB12]OSX60787.1 hypothetical protein POSPLADRAFT_1047155 [Postia placenta MAD-698-R-SB12]
MFCKSLRLVADARDGVIRAERLAVAVMQRTPLAVARTIITTNTNTSEHQLWPASGPHRCIDELIDIVLAATQTPRENDSHRSRAISVALASPLARSTNTYAAMVPIDLRPFRGGPPRDREVTQRSLSDEADPPPGSPARTNTANRARQASQEAARRGIACAKKGGPGQGSIVGCARRSTAPIRCGDASRLAAALSWRLDVRRGSGRRSPAGQAVGVAKRGRRAQGGGGCGSLAARLGREWASSRADLQRTTHGAERAIALCHGRGALEGMATWPRSRSAKRVIAEAYLADKLGEKLVNKAKACGSHWDGCHIWTGAGRVEEGDPWERDGTEKSRGEDDLGIAQTGFINPAFELLHCRPPSVPCYPLALANVNAPTRHLVPIGPRRSCPRPMSLSSFAPSTERALPSMASFTSYSDAPPMYSMSGYFSGAQAAPADHAYPAADSQYTSSSRTHSHWQPSFPASYSPLPSVDSLSSYSSSSPPVMPYSADYDRPALVDSLRAPASTRAYLPLSTHDPNPDPAPVPTFGRASWSSALYIVDPESPFQTTPAPAPPASPARVKSEEDSDGGFIFELPPAGCSPASAGPAFETMPEVPLRATHACKAMRALMSSFRLDPFAMHNGIRSAAVTAAPTGIEVGPLREEPLLFEWQAHLDVPLVPPSPSWSARSLSPMRYPLNDEPEEKWVPRVDTTATYESFEQDAAEDAAFEPLMTPAQSLAWSTSYAQPEQHTSAYSAQPLSVFRAPQAQSAQSQSQSHSHSHSHAHAHAHSLHAQHQHQHQPHHALHAERDYRSAMPIRAPAPQHPRCTQEYGEYASGGAHGVATGALSWNRRPESGLTSSTHCERRMQRSTKAGPGRGGCGETQTGCVGFRGVHENGRSDRLHCNFATAKMFFVHHPLAHTPVCGLSDNDKLLAWIAELCTLSGTLDLRTYSVALLPTGGGDDTTLPGSTPITSSCSVALYGHQATNKLPGSDHQQPSASLRLAVQSLRHALRPEMKGAGHALREQRASPCRACRHEAPDSSHWESNVDGRIETPLGDAWHKPASTGRRQESIQDPAAKTCLCPNSSQPPSALVHFCDVERVWMSHAPHPSMMTYEVPGRGCENVYADQATRAPGPLNINGALGWGGMDVPWLTCASPTAHTSLTHACLYWASSVRGAGQCESWPGNWRRVCTMRCARASELAGIECERKTVCYAILRLYLAPHTLGLHEGRLRGGHGDVQPAGMRWTNDSVSPPRRRRSCRHNDDRRGHSITRLSILFTVYGVGGSARMWTDASGLPDSIDAGVENDEQALT